MRASDIGALLSYTGVRLIWSHTGFLHGNEAALDTTIEDRGHSHVAFRHPRVPESLTGAGDVVPRR
jgi:hypothetical protein